MKDDLTLNYLNDTAKSMTTTGNWGKDAIEINKKIIEINSSDTSAYTRLGKCYMLQNDIPSAISMYKEALKLDNKNMIAINNLYVLEPPAAIVKASKKVTKIVAE